MFSFSRYIFVGTQMLFRRGCVDLVFHFLKGGGVGEQFIGKG
jgi:hypothetical protein